MKKFLRHPAVQATLGFILGLWLIIIHRTVRWTHENLEPCQADFDGTRGAIALIWHGRLPICLGVGHMWRKRARNCLISPSGDGEFIAQALAVARASGYLPDGDQPPEATTAARGANSRPWCSCARCGSLPTCNRKRSGS